MAAQSEILYPCYGAVRLLRTTKNLSWHSDTDVKDKLISVDTQNLSKYQQHIHLCSHIYSMYKDISHLCITRFEDRPLVSAISHQHLKFIPHYTLPFTVAWCWNLNFSVRNPVWRNFHYSKVPRDQLPPLSAITNSSSEDKSHTIQ